MIPRPAKENNRLSPPLKWHGGKHYLASKIIALMPPHIHYVEPFAGGLSVLLAKDPEGVSEVVNDLNGELTNFWAILQRPESFERFHRRLEATPFSSIEWETATEGPNDIEAACRFFVRCRQSMAGRMKDFAPLSRTRTRRGMNEQASAWIAAVDGLPAVHARLRRVVILNRNALSVIVQQDGLNTLFYLDPPYYPDSRAAPEVYAHEMSVADHWTLLGRLATIEGKFMLSGYRNLSYDQAAESNGWRRVDFDLPNHAAGGKEKRRMTECVWMNY